MPGIKIITGPACNRCRFVEPLLEKHCKENGYTLEVKDVSEATPEEIGEATSLPVTWWGDEQIDYDTLLARITN